MPRPLRIEYPGAIYHLINRGNYRWDVFASPGAAQAFVNVLETTADRFGWEIGAYVVMRNHYHLAVRTPEPNLAAGMHWLQTTFAVRFNRLRDARGHLFQGRYKAIILQDEAVWARVVDYIHLNPLRAGVIEPALLAKFRWSSLQRFVQNKRFKGLHAEGWLRTLGWVDNPRDWGAYVRYLTERFAREQSEPAGEREGWSEGWAIGDPVWRRDLAEASRLQETSGDRSEYVDPKEAQLLRWSQRLQELLRAKRKTESDLVANGRGSVWKIELADRLQREKGASLVWLAEQLRIPPPATLRTALWRHRRTKTNVYK